LLLSREIHKNTVIQVNETITRNAELHNKSWAVRNEERIIHTSTDAI